jgi:hypothetical protein
MGGYGKPGWWTTKMVWVWECPIEGCTRHLAHVQKAGSKRPTKYRFARRDGRRHMRVIHGLDSEATIKEVKL